MKISFLAPSSYGKTTATNILKKHFNTTNIRIADPLYDLQNYFYHFIDKSIDEKQDAELLQFLGIKIRKEKPEFLIDEFQKTLKNANSDIITNDDCRPPDYDYLKNMGFIFIKINAHPRDRVDHTKANTKNKIEWQEEIPFDYSLNNYGNLIEFEKNILNLIKEIIKDEKILHNTKRKMLR